MKSKCSIATYLTILYNAIRKRTGKFVTCKNIAPLSKIVAPDENIEKSTVNGCFFVCEKIDIYMLYLNLSRISRI